MVEAAGIEPSQGTDTFTTVSEQKPCTNGTHQRACEELIDTFLTGSVQDDNTLLRSVCETFVKWATLPALVRKAVEQWDSLPKDVQKGLRGFLVGQTKARLETVR